MHVARATSFQNTWNFSKDWRYHKWMPCWTETIVKRKDESFNFEAHNIIHHHHQENGWLDIPTSLGPAFSLGHDSETEHQRSMCLLPYSKTWSWIAKRNRLLHVQFIELENYRKEARHRKQHSVITWAYQRALEQPVAQARQWITGRPIKSQERESVTIQHESTRTHLSTHDQ